MAQPDACFHVITALIPSIIIFLPDSNCFFKFYFEWHQEQKYVPSWRLQKNTMMWGGKIWYCIRPDRLQCHTWGDKKCHHSGGNQKHFIPLLPPLLPHTYPFNSFTFAVTSLRLTPSYRDRGGKFPLGWQTTRDTKSALATIAEQLCGYFHGHKRNHLSNECKC